MARVAIVTGGTRGIGRAICEHLKADGFTVVANYAGNDGAARRAARIWASPLTNGMWATTRPASTAAPGGARGRTRRVVVNNAGITRDGTLHRMSFDDWNEVMRINLGGCFNMAKACFPACASAAGGRIVNIGSINGRPGSTGQVNYAAAKSGIHGFTKALAQEGAKAGVTVNADRPGYIDTTWCARCRSRAGKDRRQDPGRAL
jgi:acetoacetyl-CoA reductase